MPTSIFTVLTWIIEATWELSLAVVPTAFLVSPLYYWWQGDADGVHDLVITGQRELVLQYGIYLIAGLLLGGTLHTFIGTGTSFAVGAFIGAAVGVYGLVTEDLPLPAETAFVTWHDHLALLWFGVPLLAAAALTTQHTALLNLTTLVFYGVIFWEL